jgi:hypothetical protein
MSKNDQYGEFKNRAVYQRIVRPERLQYTHDSGADGEIGTAKKSRVQWYSSFA